MRKPLVCQLYRQVQGWITTFLLDNCWKHLKQETDLKIRNRCSEAIRDEKSPGDYRLIRCTWKPRKGLSEAVDTINKLFCQQFWVILSSYFRRKLELLEVSSNFIKLLLFIITKVDSPAVAGLDETYKLYVSTIFCSGHQSTVVPPLPIPNRVVKRSSADNSWSARVCRR